MKKYILLFSLLLLLTGCSSDLAHTWNIDRFAIQKANGQESESTNIGTITFLKNGSGSRDIHYAIFDQKYTDQSAFNWEKIKEGIIIQPIDSTVRSPLNKAWIVVKSSRKNQVWKSTNGKTQIEILELSRE